MPCKTFNNNNLHETRTNRNIISFRFNLMEPFNNKKLAELLKLFNQKAYSILL